MVLVQWIQTNGFKPLDSNHWIQTIALRKALPTINTLLWEIVNSVPITQLMNDEKKADDAVFDDKVNYHQLNVTNQRKEPRAPSASPAVQEPNPRGNLRLNVRRRANVKRTRWEREARKAQAMRERKKKDDAKRRRQFQRANRERAQREAEADKTWKHRDIEKECGVNELMDRMEKDGFMEATVQSGALKGLTWRADQVGVEEGDYGEEVSEDRAGFQETELEETD